MLANGTGWIAKRENSCMSDSDIRASALAGKDIDALGKPETQLAAIRAAKSNSGALRSRRAWLQLSYFVERGKLESRKRCNTTKLVISISDNRSVAAELAVGRREDGCVPLLLFHFSTCCFLARVANPKLLVFLTEFHVLQQEILSLTRKLMF